MEFFDTHAHYNDDKFETDREELLKKIYDDGGITKIVCNGYNLEMSKFACSLADKYDFMYATVGVSPNDLDNLDDDYLIEIEKEANRKKVVAIGEIGLDYYWNKENKDIQKKVFIEQINIANKLSLPITIHTRDAYLDTIEILKKYPVEKKGIFHCCPLNQELVKDALKLGYYISFSGNITFKNAKSKEVIELVPMDKILIETDSPYLSPEPHRGERNDSRNVKFVAKKISEVKQLTIKEVAKITYDNALNVYEIK